MERIYRFYYETLFADDSGYSVVTKEHSPIEVLASTKEEATKEVFRVYKDVEYKRGWSLRARLINCVAVNIVERNEDEARN